MWLVQQQAARSLGKVADPDDIRPADVLEKATSWHQDKKVRQAARKALDMLKARNQA